MAQLNKEDLHNLIKFYEQIYFTHDKPVPFLSLNVYPVLVEDYYPFYAALSVVRMDKNEDIEGISMSNLGYLFHKIEDEDSGSAYYSQLVSLLEIVFRIKNGLKCPKCGSIITYETIQEEIKKINLIKEQGQRDKLLRAYINTIDNCSKCSTDEEIVQREQIIRLYKNNNKPILNIDGVEINKNNYDLLRDIILYYNLPDYDDEYIDPELKKELEEVARLKNPNSVQPSLEKQMSCIISATGAYTYESLQKLSIRKLVLLLRTIDARLHYFAYRQGELSGMVKFDKEIDHWIYSSDKKNKYEDIMSLDTLKNKLKDVT